MYSQCHTGQGNHASGRPIQASADHTSNPRAPPQSPAPYPYPPRPTRIPREGGGPRRPPGQTSLCHSERSEESKAVTGKPSRNVAHRLHRPTKAGSRTEKKAEGAGFEPALQGYRKAVFKTAAFVLSATPPKECATPYQYWKGGMGGQAARGAGVYFAVEAMTNILRKLRVRGLPAGGGTGLQDWFRRFHLDTVRVNVGVATANISFGDADRDAAWELYIEMLTRIVTQPLPQELGDELTALDSVYALFGITRDILRRQGGIQFSLQRSPCRFSTRSCVRLQQSGTEKVWPVHSIKTICAQSIEMNWLTSKWSSESTLQCWQRLRALRT